MEPGSPVALVMTKWGERPHWEMPTTYLGADEHGDWVGLPVGTVMERPGLVHVTPNAQVCLVPRGEPWVATFHGPGGTVWTYVDMTTVPVWDGATVRAVDLDLDVVEPLEGPVYVDDEGEFAEHQVTLGYPADVVALAEASRDAALPLVRERRAPFDGTSARWLAALAEL